ncbi:trypsin-like peptidase domain-containing protein [Candidatus Microgenomates bacterium]|nr:trypsin-like peptidase domain-containing protein [Candidatus Microgenomates bacterium]
MATPVTPSPYRYPQAKRAINYLRVHAASLVLGLVAGLIGGLLAIFGVNDYFSLGRDRSRQVVLEESSAIIDVVNKVSPSVVNITTAKQTVDLFGQRQTTESGAGSGIIIRSDGLILTNRHVVDSGDNISVKTADDKEYKNAKVIGRDPLNDLAYIKIEATNLATAELGDSDQVVVGQRVVAIGNALGFEHTVTSGIISGKGRPVTARDGASEVERLQDLLQTDAAINPGNSGGPLVDINGHVIGINTAVAGGAENIGFSIPINQAKVGIASIEATGKLEKAYLGVRYVELNPDTAAEFDLKVTEGAYLLSGAGQPAVVPDGPADQAGLKERDIIISVNNEPITARRSLVTLIGKYRPGETVQLKVLRGDRQLEIKVTLGVLPED